MDGLGEIETDTVCVRDRKEGRSQLTLKHLADCHFP